MEQEKQVSSVKPKKQKITKSFTLLSNAIEEWWKNLGKFVMMYVWGILLALVPMIILGGLSVLDNLTASGGMAMRIVIVVIATICMLFVLYFFIRSYAGLFLLVKKNYQGKTWDIYKETKKYFWPYFGLVILTSVFILLWSLLLIIPGIIFSILYAMAVYIFFFEGKKGMTAIKASVRLVKGYWWPLFGRFVLLGVILWIFMMFVSIPLYVFEENGALFNAWNVVVQIVSFLIGPISLLFGYNIYKDLVKLKK